MGDAASESVLLLVACIAPELLASTGLTDSLVCCSLRFATALAPSSEYTVVTISVEHVQMNPVHELNVWYGGHKPICYA